MADAASGLRGPGRHRPSPQAEEGDIHAGRTAPMKAPVAQLTLAALVPALRGLGTQVTRAAARRFNQVAWPAFAVLVATGAWNIAAEQDKITGSYRTTLIIKLVVVAASGITAFLHARARHAASLA